MSQLSKKCELYRVTHLEDLRNEILIESMPLIEQVARQTRNLYIHFWGIEDAVSIGILAAIECIESYDESKGITFEAYTYSKIRFRIIDELRSYGFIPRRVSSLAKKVNEAYLQLSNQLMRSPSDVELAEFMDMDLAMLSRHYQEVASSQMLSIDEMVDTYGDRDLEDQHQMTPEAIFGQKEDKKRLAWAIGQLSEKEQILVNLYYVENLKLKEIGEVFEVSEARVSQLHSQIMKKLRGLLKEDFL